MKPLYFRLPGLSIALLSIALSGCSNSDSRSKTPPTTQSPLPLFESELKRAEAEGLVVDLTKVTPPVPPDQNAWIIYRKWSAWLASGEVRRDEIPRLSSQDLSKRNIQELNRFEKTLASKPFVITMIRDASRRPYCRFDRDWSKAWTEPQPEVGELRMLANWAQRSSQLHQYYGRAREALADVGLCFQIAEHLAQTPSEFHLLTSDAIYRSALRQLSSILLQTKSASVEREAGIMLNRFPGGKDVPLLRGAPLTIQWVVRLMQGPDAQGRLELGIQSPPTPGSSLTLGALSTLMEPSITAQELNQVAVAAAKPNFSMVTLRRLNLPFVLPMSLSEPPRTDSKAHAKWIDENAANAIGLFRRLAAASKQSSSRLLDQCYSEAARIYSKLGNLVSPANIGKNLPPSPHALESILLNNMIGIARARRWDQTESQRAALQTAMQIRAFRAKQGRLPQNLQEMGVALSKDPYSGNPLGYRVTPKGFTIWSVGPTGRYDGLQYDEDETRLNWK